MKTLILPGANYGGTNLHEQCAQMLVGVDILIPTPGGLLRTLKKGVANGVPALSLENLRLAFFDEGDTLMDAKFNNQVQDIEAYMGMCSVSVHR